MVTAEDFLEHGWSSLEVMKLYHKIRNAIRERSDYSLLGISCYICKRRNHIALDCPSFTSKRGGNLVKLYNEIHKEGGSRK
jgi:hypothetical protein